MDQVASSSFVEGILNEAQSSVAFKTIEVHKFVEPLVDLGNLLLEDRESLGPKLSESDLRNRARDNVQYLVNEIWKLPSERVEDVIVVKVPKQRPATRWAEFAKLKGIKGRKKPRKIWDEVSECWKPVWGYKRANDSTKNWLIEIPDQKDPLKDYFAEKVEAKREATAKNELKRLKNLHKKTAVSSFEGIGMNNQSRSSRQLSKLVAQTRKATASVGKFSEALPKEKPPKFTGKKRKFTPNEVSSKVEKERQLEILKRMDAKKPRLDLDKAASRQTNEEKKLQKPKLPNRQKQRSNARSTKKHGRNRNVAGQQKKK